jgi:hypothetical protein
MIVGADVAAATDEEAEGATDALGTGAWHAARTNKRTTTRRTLRSWPPWFDRASEFPQWPYELRCEE